MICPVTGIYCGAAGFACRAGPDVKEFPEVKEEIRGIKDQVETNEKAVEDIKEEIEIEEDKSEFDLGMLKVKPRFMDSDMEADEMDKFY